MAVMLVLGAGLSSVATYAALSGAAPFTPSSRSILILLLINLSLLMVLGVVVAQRLVRLWVARRAGSAGSRLHIRMVRLFAMLAAAPTIIIAMFSVLYFHLGLEAWFSDRVRTVLQESVLAAEAYLDEHRKVIRADVLAMANDVNRLAPEVGAGRIDLGDLVVTQAALRSLPEAIIFNSSGEVLAKTQLSYGVGIDALPDGALQEVSSGDVFILTNDNEDRVRALLKLDRFIDAYLFVGRFLDPRVLGHVRRTEAAIAEYENLEGARSGIEITFTMIFMVVALLVLLAAIWFGLAFATRIVAPVGRLVTAVERVRDGDLEARVDESRTEDEISTLSSAFNRMTERLSTQQSELTEANEQLDQRWQFTEAVLAGVTAGVVGLDAEGIINLSNKSASVLLARPADELAGRPFAEAVPEMAALLRAAGRRRGRVAEDQIAITRNSVVHNLLVRIVAEWSEGSIKGYVVTFDDLTDLLVAQRRAAWADVARRIAHEIKNPLTPIQLSAERLRRKYQDEIDSDPEIFAQCTDTIIRQVGDIGRMVDEFSSFARMPAPIFADQDLTELARQAVFLGQVGSPETRIEMNFPEHAVVVSCDEQQVSRVFTNLLKNAAESISMRKASDDEKMKGHIVVAIENGEDLATVSITDNGPGFPTDMRERLTEPYVTTRAKGTGLGLAIVKKVMEEHGGELNLLDAPDGGALVQLVFHRDSDHAAVEADAERRAS